MTHEERAKWIKRIFVLALAVGVIGSDVRCDPRVFAVDIFVLLAQPEYIVSETGCKIRDVLCDYPVDIP